MRRLLITMQTEDEVVEKRDLTPYAQNIVDFVSEDKVYSRREIAIGLDYLVTSVITKVDDLISKGYLKQVNNFKCPITKREVTGVTKI